MLSGRSTCGSSQLYIQRNGKKQRLHEYPKGSMYQAGLVRPAKWRGCSNFYAISLSPRCTNGNEEPAYAEAVIVECRHVYQPPRSRGVMKQLAFLPVSILFKSKPEIRRDGSFSVGGYLSNPSEALQ